MIFYTASNFFSFFFLLNTRISFFSSSAVTDWFSVSFVKFHGRLYYNCRLHFSLMVYQNSCLTKFFSVWIIFLTWSIHSNFEQVSAIFLLQSYSYLGTIVHTEKQINSHECWYPIREKFDMQIYKPYHYKTLSRTTRGYWKVVDISWWWGEYSLKLVLIFR